MKFSYSKKVNDTTVRKAGFDTEVVSHWELVEIETGNVLVAYLALSPVDTYTDVPRLNGKGVINGYDQKKVLDVPKIYLTNDVDIDSFISIWESQQ